MCNPAIKYVLIFRSPEQEWPRSTSSRTVAFDQFFGPYGAMPNGQGATDQSWSGIDNTKASGISNLYDAEFREFEDVAGRFPSPDPAGTGSMTVGVPQSLNRYAYTEGEPLLTTDPSGEFGLGIFDFGDEGPGDWDPSLPGLGFNWGWMFHGAAEGANVVKTPTTAQVHDYSGVNWNGALQGEVDGMPIGMTVPQENPFSFGTPGSGQACDFGPCNALTGQVQATPFVFKIDAYGRFCSNSNPCQGSFGLSPEDAQALAAAAEIPGAFRPLEKLEFTNALLNMAVATVVVHVAIMVGAVAAGCFQPLAELTCVEGGGIALAALPGTIASGYTTFVIVTKTLPAIWEGK